MTQFDPVNDRLDVYSAALGGVAEVSGVVIVERSLPLIGGFLPLVGGTMSGPIVADGVLTGARILGEATPLALADFGKLLEFTGTAAFSEALPDPSTGMGVFFYWNNSTLTQTFTSGGDGQFVTPTGISSSYGVAPDERGILVSDGTNYVQIVATDPPPSRTMPIYRKYPDGTVEQVFLMSGIGPGEFVGAFPRPFPNTCTNLIVSDTGVLTISYGVAPGVHTTGLGDGGGSNAQNQFTIWTNADAGVGWVAVIIAEGY